MNLITVFFVCAGLWVFLRWIAPIRSRKLLLAGDLSESAKAGGVLAVLGLLSLLMFAACVTAGMILVVTWWLQDVQGDSIPALETLLTRLRGWASIIKVFGGGWAWLCGGLVLVGGSIFYHRLGKARSQADLSRKAEMESEEVFRQAQEGTLKDLPPSDEMKQLFKLGEDLVRRRSEMIRAGVKSQDVDELDRLLDQIRQEITRMDIVRRMNLQMSDAELKLEQPDTFLGRAGTFFVAPGLARLLTRGTRWTLAAVTAAFMACSIGFQADGLAKQLDGQIAVAEKARERLVFGGAVTAAAAAYDQAVEQLPAGEALSKEEEEELDDLASQVATAYEQRLVGYYAQAPRVTPGVRNVFQAQATLLRDELLKTHAASTKAAEHVASDLTQSKTVMADTVRRSVSGVKSPGPATEAGREVRESTVKAVRKGGKSLLNKLRQEMASFQVPMRPGTVGQILVSEFGGDLLDGRSRERFDFRSTLDEDLRKAMARGNSGRAREFVTKAVVEGKMADAMDAVFPADAAAERYHPPGDMDAIHKVVPPEAERIGRPVNMDTGSPPGLRARTEPHVNLPAVEKHISGYYVRSGGGEQMRQNLDVLADYPDYFPGRVGEENLTPQGRLRTNLESESFVRKAADDTNALLAERMPPDSPSTGGGGKSPGPKGTGGRMVSTPQPLKAAPRASSVASVTRARSFSMLRGFARVGGVLIGREPEQGGPAVEVTTLDWQITADKKVVLRARGRVTGQEREWTSSPLEPDAVYCAMMYAADGRATAVTMVRANPLPELKILAHPAVLDTRIGQALIDLDRFVDRFANDEPREEAQNVVQSADMLYQLAWNARASLLVKHAGQIESIFRDGAQLKRVIDNVKAGVDETKQEAGIGGKGSEKYVMAMGMLKKSGVGKEVTPLSSKTEFYEMSLVKRLETALRDSGTVDQLWNHLVSGFEAELTPNTGRNPYLPSGRGKGTSDPKLLGALYGLQGTASRPDDEKLAAYVKTALTRTPEFQIWSGVRESKFKADEANLLPDAGQQPFDFMLQVAFTTPPEFGAAASQEDDYSDQNPWEFPSIAKWIRDEVAKQVKEDAESMETLRLSSQFALSQRFFRLGLEGGLGEEFPLTRLKELASALKPLLPPAQRTPRWNARRGSLEATLASLTSKVKEIAGTNASTEVRALLDQASLKLKSALQQEDRFRDACLKLLAAEDRGSIAWNDSWNAAWDEAEKAKIEWEKDWHASFLPLQRLGVHAPGASASGQEAQLRRLFSLMDLQSSAIQVRRDLGVHVDDRQSLLGYSKKEALMSLLEKQLRAPSASEQ